MHDPGREGVQFIRLDPHALALDDDRAPQHDEDLVAVRVEMWGRILPRVVGPVEPDLEVTGAEGKVIRGLAPGNRRCRNEGMR
ncbi:MAG TPA: hypothetical protein VGR08_14190 [Thermomicrobiales bacterium]|nr:hypothetical protein [Thermomicrobiales bacterium]